MPIDFTTPVGKTRLRTGDVTDGLFMFPDEVYVSTLVDTNQNISQAARTICYYILALMTQSSNVTLGALSIYDGDTAKAYMEYLKMVIKDTSFNGVCPIAHGGGIDTPNKVVEAYDTWNNNDRTRFLRDQVKDSNPYWPSL